MLGLAKLRNAIVSEDNMACKLICLLARSTLGVVAGATMLVSQSSAQTPLKVMVFPGLANWSIFAADHKGLFAKHGIALEIINTPSSDAQRERLAKGEV